MKKKTDRRRGLDLSAGLNLAVVTAFTALVLWGIFLVREKILQNTQEMGTSLAESYAAEEQSRIQVYGLLIRLGLSHMDKIAENGGSREEIQGWLADYDRDLAEILGVRVVDPYAVVDGEILAAAPWEGDGDYAYENTEWYQRASAQAENTIFTDAYRDVITGREMITIARESGKTGNLLAFDVFLDNFYVHKNHAELPERSSFLLFDSSDHMIYSDTDLTGSEKEVEEYTSRLLSQIREGEMESFNASIRDLDGKRRGVYYYEMDNGWISVITIPMDTILQGEVDGIFLFLLGVCLLLLAVVLFTVFRAFLGRERLRRVSDTLTILGDSYYGIYRVNYARGTYETVKSPEDVAARLGTEGDYRELMKVMEELVDEKTIREFKECFSLENIRRLIGEKVYDFGGDYKRMFEDGYRWVNARMIYSHSLGLDEVILCFREVDAEKQLQLKQQMLLESSLEAAKKSTRDRSIFFSHVSHDMRTPLNAVIGLSDLALEHENDPGKMGEYLRKIRQAAKQLLSLINDILDISRIEQRGEGAVDNRPSDLVRCVEECGEMFADQARKEEKTLTVSCQVRSRVANCDPFRISQIINNLVSNALKYSGAGASISLTLRQLEHGAEEGKYQIVVEDTGFGMSEEFQKQIFQPFTRETTFTPVTTVGTGLGMPIVKNLVQQMGGEITVRSRLGEGSTFTVTLPLTPADAPEEGTAGEERAFGETAAAGKSVSGEAAAAGKLSGEAAAAGKLSGEERAGAETTPGEHPLAGKRILVAEDNEINMEIAVEFLTMMGAEVMQAKNGQEAVEQFAQSAPGSVDVILMDMQMPVMDGCEASRRIRDMDRPDGRTVIIVAVTANAFAEDVARTREAGMDGHLAKPIDFQALVQLLRTLGESEKGRQPGHPV